MGIEEVGYSVRIPPSLYLLSTISGDREAHSFSTELQVRFCLFLLLLVGITSSWRCIIVSPFSHCSTNLIIILPSPIISHYFSSPHFPINPQLLLGLFHLSCHLLILLSLTSPSSSLFYFFLHFLSFISLTSLFCKFSLSFYINFPPPIFIIAFLLFPLTCLCSTLY